MFKLYAYGPLTIGSGKLEAVVAIKNFHKIGLKEAKDWVDGLPRILENQSSADVEFYQKHFSCGVEDSDASIQMYRYKEPDEETKVALQWYDAQPKYVQEMIDAVGKWNNPIVVACG